ncbi:MAG: DUF2089 domain-containing protein [Fimbriimonadaceae bacterium]|nr:DUF2089 domain-containing protein [Fimbriimonadaceae bacterium]
MAKDVFHEIPAKCPVTGEPLYVSELTSLSGDVVLRGRFKLPQTTRLDQDQQRFLEVFIRARGVISTMEKELGLSYPTVRARLDGLLDALGYEPLKTSGAKDDSRAAEARRKVLKMLEDGKLTAADAKAKLKELGTK